MNLRTITGFKNGYYEINREERNLAAIFYHLLLQNDNLNKFLKLLQDKYNFSGAIIQEELAVYYEYAFVRDLWKKIEIDNNKKKTFILESLMLDADKFNQLSIEEFNEYFGAVRTPSKNQIVSPANWSIQSFNEEIRTNKELLLEASMLKWSFNAKPDIVIHTSNNSAICIEAKLVSGEGKYPTNEADKNVFKKVDAGFVSQLEVQIKLMNDILDIETGFFILKNGRNKKDEFNKVSTLTWNEVFSLFDIQNESIFIKNWLSKNEILK